MDYTAIVKHSGEWWIGWVQEVPGVTCQEHTREELMDALAITLAEMLGGLPPSIYAGLRGIDQPAPVESCHDSGGQARMATSPEAITVNRLY